MTRHPRLSLVGVSALGFALAGCGGMSATSDPAAAPAPSAAGSSAPGSRPPAPAANQPRTRAERTSYKETSSQGDVVAFIDSLQRLGAPIWVGTLATTVEGRDIPYVVASRPLVTTPAQARRLGRPVLFIQGNIHSGEVEGKEALQMILRDLLLSDRRNALDSVVLIAVPNYNADGNERLAPQARARGSQQGPEMVGTRANASGLNLNRDYMKAETPETRGALAIFNEWDPDLFVDLHTSNGSMHGYALTYAPPLNPASFPIGGAYSRDSVVPVLRARMRSRHGFETFDYGNFNRPDTTGRWATYEHVPRFGTNYYGLRGRLSILSEAYSHDPFERRVASTYAFVQEILSLMAERAPRVIALSRAADEMVTAWGRSPVNAPPIPVRAQFALAVRGDILVEDVERRQGDTTRYEAGLGVGVRRTGNFRAVRMSIVDRFVGTRERPMPTGYILDAFQSDAVDLLRLHGVVVQQLDAPLQAAAEAFTADSVMTGSPFEGHPIVRLEGRWRAEQRTFPAGAYLISTAQPLGVLAVYLLEPESDDGLVAWNLFDWMLRPGGQAPIVRLTTPVAAAATIVR
jgi:hypothetical protein